MSPSCLPPFPPQPPGFRGPSVRVHHGGRGGGGWRDRSLRRGGGGETAAGHCVVQGQRLMRASSEPWHGAGRESGRNDGLGHRRGWGAWTESQGLAGSVIRRRKRDPEVLVTLVGV